MYTQRTAAAFQDKKENSFRKGPGVRVFSAVLAALCSVVILGSALAAAPAEERSVTYHLDIPAQDLNSALQQLALASQHKLFYKSELVEGKTSQTLKGEFTTDEAIQRLLAGTHLTYDITPSSVVLIKDASEKPIAHASQLGTFRLAQGDDPNNSETSDRDTAKGSFWKRFRLVQSSEASPSSAEQSDQNPKEDSGQGGQLEEIVVTAQKREEKLSDVPISISAYDQATMDRRGIKDISDVALTTPGLNFSSEGVYNRITMRGIATGSHGSEGIGASTTAIYVDDVPIQAKPISGGGIHNSASPKIFDLERVEVLRGPQGTLFGGGAVGGAVRFITPQPSLTEYSGYSRAEISDTDGGGLSNEFGVAVGGPIIQDKLGFRISGSYSHNGGYIDHLSTIPGAARERNADESDSYVAHVALTFAPIDSVRLTPSIHVQDLNARDLTQFSPLDSGPGEFLVTTPLLTPIKDKFYIPSFKAEADFGAVSLASITSYFHRDFSNDIDYSFTIPAAFGAPLPTSLDRYEVTRVNTTQNNFVQEIRLSSSDPVARLKWTVGGYYSNARTDGFQVIEAPSFPDFILEQFGVPIEDIFGTGLVDGLYSYFVDNHVRSKDLAGYVNVEYKLLSQVSLIAGVRASRLEEQYDLLQRGPLGGILQTREGTQRETPITPKFGINFKPNDDTLLYLSAAKGFRGGGVNKALPTTNDDACRAAIAALGADGLSTYESDSLWSYEAGYKGSLFSDRLRVDASAYHIVWKDIQSSVQACLGDFITNFGEAESDGFDLVLDARIVDNLSASIAVGYTDAQYTKTTELNNRVYVREGAQVSDISPWTISASLQYGFAVTPSAEGYIRVEDRYASRNNGPFNFMDATTAAYYPSLVVNEATNQLNLRAGVTFDTFEISAFATNVLNDQPLLSGNMSRIIAEYGGSTIRPRTVGVTGIYRW